MLTFDKVTYLSLLFKFTFSARLSKSLWESDVLLFFENSEYSFLYYTFIELIIFLYTFLVIYFARYKEYVKCLISFSNFSDALPVFTCTRAIGNI